MGISWNSAADDHGVTPAQTPRNRSNAMTALHTTSRTLIALFAAMALVLVVVLATFTATSSNHAASTWNKVSAASTWNKVSAASTWNKVSNVGNTNASTWN